MKKSSNRNRRVPADPIGKDNPIEAILLTAFPNPERKGCPPPDVIKAMANQEVGRDHPGWNHIWNCSPCFRDFKLVRDARVARAERELERKRTRRNLIKGAAAVVASSVLTYYVAVEFRSSSRHQVAVVPIDLTNATTTRGSLAPVARLPRQLDELQLTLPPLSAVGRYVVAILKSHSENTAVALGSATAETKNGRVVVVVTLDLSETSSGQYFLGMRREVNGHQELPSYYPVLVSD